MQRPERQGSKLEISGTKHSLTVYYVLWENKYYSQQDGILFLIIAIFVLGELVIYYQGCLFVFYGVCANNKIKSIGERRHSSL